MQLLAEDSRPELSRMELIWAAGAYTAGFGEWVKLELGWRVDVPHHRARQLWRYGLEEKPRGFKILPRRWVVERTFAWLSQVRRLSKDYERLPQVAEAMIYGAMSRLMLRRLAKGAV
jgi:putative transposase